MLPAIAEIFGDAGGVGRPLHAQQRRHVRRRGDHHRARPAFGAENVLDKVFDLAATLADQANDDHIRLGITGHHAEQHALADAGAGEQAHTLAAADGQQSVDGAHPHVQHLLDRRALQGLNGAVISGAR